MVSTTCLTERVHHYFDRHPELSREEFVLKAVQHELDTVEREENYGMRRSPSSPSFPTAQDIRIHAWLNGRLMKLHRERSSLWARLCGLFSRKHPVL
jgi:hypothetical protein